MTYEEWQVRDGADPFIDLLGDMMGVDLLAGARLVSQITASATAGLL